MYALQLYLDKLDENAARIQKCEETMKDDQQNHVKKANIKYTVLINEIKQSKLSNSTNLKY